MSLLPFSLCAPLVNLFSFFPERSGVVHPGELPPGVAQLFISGPDRVTIECFHLPCATSDRILIYFHGNGGNIAGRLPELLELREKGVAVFGVGYRGYGASGGRPSERGIYRDGEGALRYIMDSLGYREERVFIMGRSLGSAVAVNTALDLKLAGVILITPFSTGNDYARAHGWGPLTFLSGNCYDNVGKAERLKAPVLVIHGTADEVVPYRMGRKLYDALPVEKKFVTIGGGMHNTLEFTDPAGYWSSIETFLQRQ